MCGLFGYAAWKNVAFPRVEAAFEQIACRGPDDRGLVSDSWFQAAHTRLSIIDLSWRGHQPFHGASKRYTVVYNGEIYNFKSLNAGLRAEGVVLQTESDTETLVELFEKKNVEAFAQLQGMFSGAIFDKAERAVYLFRDRLGIKPLFFHIGDGGVAFASTAEAVAQLRDGCPVDRREYMSYLAFRSAQVDRSMYEGIEALRPGTVLKISADGQGQTVFWSVTDFLDAPREDMSEEEAVETTRELLQAAVRKRLLADVPVGAFLSGGLDSTIVVHYMSEMMREPVMAHTFSSLNDAMDEVERAQRSAAHYGARCFITDIDYSGYFDDLNRLTSLKGAPLTVPNEYAIFKMAQRMKETNTVVLSGEASDEIFWGYSNIFTAAAHASQSLSKREIAQWIFDKYRYVSPEALTIAGFDDAWRQAYINNGVDYVERVILECDSSSVSSNLQYFFLRHHLPSLLMRLDNATMAASIEGRVPFTDHALIEFALSIPAHLKLGQGEGGTSGKRILYKAFGDLPEWVVKTPKIGFKLGDTLAGRPEVKTLFKRAGLPKFDWLDAPKSGVSSMEKWHLTMLALFVRQKDENLHISVDS